jgi:SAM-dependent methyltransferase
MQPADERRAEGRRLVDEIRARGERVVADLGCGFRKEGNVGIDTRAEGTAADLICNLGFEPLPLDDACVDEVFCRDFLEHVPKAVYSERTGGLLYPVITLVNEVWRVLKPGGFFVSQTPCYPHAEVFQDPTHLSVWTTESMAYFCGKYPVASVYGIEATFEMLENRVEGFYLHSRLRKPAS